MGGVAAVVVVVVVVGSAGDIVVVVVVVVDVLGVRARAFVCTCVAPTGRTAVHKFASEICSYTQIHTNAHT